jgi:hypothetical protein
MIPRPEHEAKLYQDEAQRQEEQLAILQNCAKQIRDSDGHSQRQRHKLSRMGIDSHAPLSFGYEVIPHNDSYPEESSYYAAESTRTLETKAPSFRHSVMLTADKDDFVEPLDSKELVLESDGVSTYQINSRNECCHEEEGLEVVGLGRYSTLAEDTEVHGYDLLTSESKDSVIQDKESRLSQMYTSSEKIEVAFYRPFQAIQTMDDID